MNSLVNYKCQLQFYRFLSENNKKTPYFTQCHSVEYPRNAPLTASKMPERSSSESFWCLQTIFLCEKSLSKCLPPQPTFFSCRLELMSVFIHDKRHVDAIIGSDMTEPMCACKHIYIIHNLTPAFAENRKRKSQPAGFPATRQNTLIISCLRSNLVHQIESASSGQ